MVRSINRFFRNSVLRVGAMWPRHAGAFYLRLRRIELIKKILVVLAASMGKEVVANVDIQAFSEELASHENGGVVVDTLIDCLVESSKSDSVAHNLRNMQPILRHAILMGTSQDLESLFMDIIKGRVSSGANPPTTATTAVNGISLI
jgi:hypothetical protein